MVFRVFLSFLRCISLVGGVNQLEAKVFIYNSSIIVISSIVIIVSYYITKLIIPKILIYLYNYIKELSTKVLNLKDYSILIYLLYNYYTIYI